MADRKYYVVCDYGCRFESMTKEQILTAIAQAVNEGTIGDIDTGFVQTIKTISGTPLKFFVGEQHEYENLTEEQRKNLFAIITNDTTKEGILTALEAHATNLEAHSAKIAEHSEKIEEWESGAVAVPKANRLSPSNPIRVDYAGVTTSAPDVRCDLESNTVYHVLVRDKTTSRIVTNFILPIGDLSIGENFSSTVGSDSAKAFYMYRGSYLQWANGNWYFNLGRADLSSASEQSFKSVLDATNLEVVFTKIADFPI